MVLYFVDTLWFSLCLMMLYYGLVSALGWVLFLKKQVFKRGTLFRTESTGLGGRMVHRV